jgi:hypothetical protein
MGGKDKVVQIRLSRELYDRLRKWIDQRELSDLIRRLLEDFLSLKEKYNGK